MALSRGDRLGRYDIMGALGAGGMGEVYRALDRTLEREVAIKVLPADFAADPERLRRFEREARATAALSHPDTRAHSLPFPQARARTWRRSRDPRGTPPPAAFPPLATGPRWW